MGKRVLPWWDVCTVYFGSGATSVAGQEQGTSRPAASVSLNCATPFAAITTPHHNDAQADSGISNSRPNGWRLKLCFPISAARRDSETSLPHVTGEVFYSLAYACLVVYRPSIQGLDIMTTHPCRSLKCNNRTCYFYIPNQELPLRNSAR